MQSTCLSNSGSALEACLSSVILPGKLAELRPSLAIQDRNGYSSPRRRTPTILPSRSSGLAIPLSLRQASSMPECLNPHSPDAAACS